MISVIVCSVNKELLEKLSSNIAATIGLEYELLVTDNSIEKRSIAAVYNQSAEKARFPFLCFVHEDVIIHTENWGQEIMNLLEQKDIGLVGISGAVYKSAYPSTWSACEQKFYRIHSIQHFSNQQLPVVTNVNPDNVPFANVAVIDGVFMATRKEIFKQYSFDEKLLKGFHGYDIDFSLQVGQQYQVLVTYNLLLEHLSEGNCNNQWIKANLLVHRKWKNKLPLNVQYPQKKNRVSDYIACSSMLAHLIKARYGVLYVLKYYFIVVICFFKENKFKYSKSVLKYFTK